MSGTKHDQTNDVVAYLAEMFDTLGDQEYLGEQVSMATHMLQAAHFAKRQNASDAEVAAALLHDVGHFANDIEASVSAHGVDALHEHAGAEFLARFFPPEVVEPVRQHVATKRYLCAVDASYFDRLSPASVHTLELQGGPMSAEEVAQFEKNPHLQSCISVRKWDEAGKDPALETANFCDYIPLLKRLLL
ncbi:MAG: HD domain-containing protein [Granulosicoccaceae bacterium]